MNNKSSVVLTISFLVILISISTFALADNVYRIFRTCQASFLPPIGCDDRDSTLPDDGDIIIVSSSSSATSNANSSSNSSNSSSSSSSLSSSSSSSVDQCIGAQIDVDIDSDNTNLYSLPDQNSIEEQEEDNSPSKIIITGDFDSDIDGIPDGVDGLYFAPNFEDLPPEQRNLLHQSGAFNRMIPITIAVSGNVSPNGSITISYPAANPLNTWYDPTTKEYQAEGLAFGPSMRIWSLSGSTTELSPYPIFSDLPDAPIGNFVPAGVRIPLTSIFGALGYGSTTLYIQPLRGASANSDPIRITALLDPTGTNGGCGNLNDSVNVSLVDLSFVDGKALNPVWTASSVGNSNSPGEGDLRFRNVNFASFEDADTVNGAITDGASLVVMRMSSQSAGLQKYLDSVSARIDRFSSTIELSGDGHTILPEQIINYRTCDIPTIYGGFSRTRYGNSVNIPPLPMPENLTTCAHENCYSREVALKGQNGALYFVPPRNSITQTNSNDRPFLGCDENPYLFAAHSSEVANMTINFVRRDPSGAIPVQVIGQAPFYLRRPPVVLIHGIRSDPQSWGDINNVDGWTEVNNEINSRLYFADYGDTRTHGYPENMGSLGKAIQRALTEYRTAGAIVNPAPPPREDHDNPEHAFNGIKYAATRVDVIGHSMGGQITRLYLSGLNNISGVSRVNYTSAAAASAASKLGITSTGYPPITINRNNTSTFDINGNNRYFRDNNFGAGDIRRFVPIGSPFKGSPIASTTFMSTDPNSYLIREALRYINAVSGPEVITRYTEVLGAIQSTGMEDEFFKLIYRYQHPVVIYDSPTGNADLVEDSPMQHLLEEAGYPNQNKAVAWFPIVGIALPPSYAPGSYHSQDADEMNRLYLNGYGRSFVFALANYILEPERRNQIDEEAAVAIGRFLRDINIWISTRLQLPPRIPGGEAFYPFAIWNSDLVVAGYSQRNALPPSNLSNYNASIREGFGFNGNSGNLPALGIETYSTVHSDSVYNSSIMTAHPSWRSLVMEQESAEIIRKAFRFLELYDGINDGVITDYFQGRTARFFLDTQNTSGHSLGRR